jgi:hypothetical protein
MASLDPALKDAETDQETVTNERIARTLEHVAALLESQDSGPFRVRAYRTAARSIRELEEPLRELFAREGLTGIEGIAGVGPSIAAAIQEILHSGHLGLLERLKGRVSPEELFMTIPGIGEALAHRIHLKLGIDSLEELELAAHDGRLERIGGFGARRARAIRDLLAARLSRSTRRGARRIESSHAAEPTLPPPSVAALLDVDEEYRRRADSGELRRIAPRRFNPRHETWLPILHTTREGWHMTAMFSNTARAHRLGKTHDWVIIYYERDGHEDQCTVVSAPRDVAPRRLIRGREGECHEFHRRQPRPEPGPRVAELLRALQPARRPPAA